MWNWFLANGDKLLNSIGVVLTGLVVAHSIPITSLWLAVLAGALSVIHQVFLPEPSTTPTPVVK